MTDFEITDKDIDRLNNDWEAHKRYKAELEKNFKPVESSSISAIAFFDDDLYVKFKNSGAVYLYKLVPREVFDRFLKAESKGRFFATYIRDKYDYDYRY